MAATNNGGNGPEYPAWARVGNLRIAFDYAGPAELGKQLMGYGWERMNYSLEWLHRRVTAYDRNKAEEMDGYRANAGCLVWATGFSIENDSYHWDIVRRRIREFHERGMHVIVYISLTNCFWREMFATVPESRDWRQVDAGGEPVPYEGIGYGGKEVTRYLMCVNNPHWRAYQKRRIAAAMEAGADGIFWDNNFTKCHCRHCQEKFHEFTRRRLGQAHDVPPPLTEPPPPEADLLSAREVVFDWIPLSHPLARVHLAKNLFRYLSILDILQELKEYTLRIKPDAIWSNNGHLCQHIYDSANLLLSEELDRPNYDGGQDRLRTNAGVLRYLYEEGGRKTTAIVNGHHPEVFAYGCAAYGERDAGINDFLQANSDLYAGAESIARVAMVAAEMNHISRRSNWFDNLNRAHVLYDVIPLHRMDQFDLGLYDVILLRSILFLSEADCRRLRQFVAAGGTLLCTNNTSLYDENWGQRGDYGLADVFGVSAGAAHKPARIEHAFGCGRSIFYYGAVELEVETDPNGPVAAAIVADVKRCVKDSIIEMDAPAGVTVNVMRAAAGLVVHVLNYTGQTVRNVRIRVLPGAYGAGTVRKVLPLGAGSDRAADLAVRDGLSFTLPQVETYTAVVVG